MKITNIEILNFAKKILNTLSKDKESSVEKVNNEKKYVLLGDGASLDSMSFVNFISEMEILISKKIKKDFVIKIDKIHTVNVGKKKLYLNDFAKVMAKIIN
jgi:hypothetical protein